MLILLLLFNIIVDLIMFMWAKQHQKLISLSIRFIASKAHAADYELMCVDFIYSTGNTFNYIPMTSSRYEYVHIARRPD